MIYIKIIAIIVIVLIVLILSRWFNKRRKKKLNKHYFQSNWRKLQKLCVNRNDWTKAVIKADDLLGEALAKKHYSGKSTGEKLVSAQREISINKEIWIAHNFKKKIIDQKITKIGKKDTVRALNSFRQALFDLGALNLVKTKKELKNEKSSKKL